MVVQKTDQLSFFYPILESFQYSSIITDLYGKVICFNVKAKSTFPLISSDSFLFEYFNEETSLKLRNIFLDVEKNNLMTKEIINLVTKDSTSIKAEVSISLFVLEEENFFIVVINDELQTSRITSNHYFTASSEKLETIFSNPEIINLIEEIKSLYPFSFINKEKLQLQINKLDEYFWIKYPSNYYLLVNDKFSNAFGLAPKQLENRNENYLIPPYLQEISNAINNYLINTLNAVIYKGIPFRGIPYTNDLETILLPITDAENKVILIIGTTQKSLKEKLNYNKSNFHLLDLPIVYSIITNRGEILDANNNFSDFFSNRSEKFKGKYIFDLFDKETSTKIEKFIQTNGEETEITTLIPDKNGLFNIKLTKFNNSNNELNNYFLIINKELGFNNLEEFIQKRGRMFEVLIKNNPEPIFIYDTSNLRFIEVNDAALKLYGYQREDFLQMDLTDLYTPEDIQTLLDSSSSMSVEKFTGPYKHRRRDGSTVLVEIFKSTFTYEGRDAHFNIVRDISEKLKSELEFKLLKTTVDFSDEIIITTDDTGFIISVNKTCSDFLGKPQNEIIGNSFLTLVNDEERGEINSKIFQSKNTSEIKLNSKLKSKNNEEIEISIKAVPILDHKSDIVLYNLLISPVQKPIEIVKEIEVIKEVETVKEISTGASTSAKSGIEATMLSTIFHEILTPINVMLGFMQELRESIQKPSSEQEESINYINQNSKQLLAIMNTIAEFSQLPSMLEESEISTLNVAKVMDSLLDELKETGNIPVGKNIVPGKISSSLEFDSDKTLFKMFLSLLCKVSLNLTKESSIYLSIYQSSDDDFTISIKDNNANISERLIKVFNLIFSTSEPSFIREYELSRFSVLSLRRLLIVLNGRIEIIKRSGYPYELGFIFPVKLTKDKLSTNIIDTAIEEKHFSKTESVGKETKEIIPDTVMHEVQDIKHVKEVVPEVHKEPEYVEPVVEKLDLSKLKCLYIEDQVDSQILFKVQMKELQDIKFAVSFEEALPLINHQKFDFIVMDINLQGEYNGLDALKIIRHMAGFDHFPIIAVTAYVLPGDKEKFIAAGFDDFISKPIFKEKMIESLEKIFLTKK